MKTLPANPPWQNFTSMFREAVTASEAKTGLERSHHLTASLYFGIAALEAFINAQMRAHMRKESEQTIFEKLRRGEIKAKLKKWPSEILNKSLAVDSSTLQLIETFNSLRGELTHPKTQGQDIYDQLDAIKPESIVETVAEFIVRFHEAEGTRYPYWLFGWNYLNPRPASYEIMLINDQQFCLSLGALRLEVSLEDAWRDRYLGTFEGYGMVKKALDSRDGCEPKSQFPYEPILCRRWWTAEHQQQCGRVSREAIDRLRKMGARFPGQI